MPLFQLKNCKQSDFPKSKKKELCAVQFLKSIRCLFEWKSADAVPTLSTFGMRAFCAGPKDLEKLRLQMRINSNDSRTFAYRQMEFLYFPARKIIGNFDFSSHLHDSHNAMDIVLCLLRSRALPI